jgi:hypothetical protein
LSFALATATGIFANGPFEIQKCFKATTGMSDVHAGEEGERQFAGLVTDHCVYDPVVGRHGWINPPAGRSLWSHSPSVAMKKAGWIAPAGPFLTLKFEC